METMYNRIKRMSEKEMKEFVYAVYLSGNEDGREGWQDSPDCSYFGGDFLHINAKDLMPNDTVNDLYKSWEIG